MDLSRACEYLHLVEAASRGETIQIKYHNHAIPGQWLPWQDVKTSAFTCPPESYRVKPTEPSKVYIVWCFNSLASSKRWKMVDYFRDLMRAREYTHMNTCNDHGVEVLKYHIQEVECPEPNDYFIVFNK